MVAVRVVGILQARMGSTRLPGKVLLDLAGQPVLAWAINRLRRAKTLDDLVVATTTAREDDAINEFCEGLGVACFRGSVDDVLDRYYQAAKAHSADVIVRVTGDDPLIDPSVVDQVVRDFLTHSKGVSYVSNVNPTRTFPRGQDTEVFSMNALEYAWREDADPQLREHVTQYMVQNPDHFKFRCVTYSHDLSSMRWAVDTEEDIEFLRTVCRHVENDSVSWLDVVSLIQAHSEWLGINRHVRQKAIGEA